MIEPSQIIGYLFIPDRLGPPDPKEVDLLLQAGAELVHTDWGSRDYRSLLLEQLQTGDPNQLLLRRLEDLGDSLEEIRSLLLDLGSQGITVQLVDDQGQRIPESSQIWIDRMGDLPTALQRRRALQRHVQGRLESKPPPGSPPYGYKRERDHYVLDRRQAAIVKDFFDHFLLYGSLRSSVRHLQHQHGKQISVSTGRRWLTHPAYRGDLAFTDGTILRNTHSPILSRQEAAQIDRWLRRNRQLPRRSASAPRSLAGLVSCDQCESSLRILQVTGKRRAKRYLYLRCPQCHYSLIYETLLQQVIQRICEELPQRSQGFDPAPLQQARADLEAQLHQNETILKQLGDLEAQGMLDPLSLQQRRYQLRAENTRLLQRLDQLPPDNLPQIAQPLSISPFWQDLTESERRAYFREFIRSITVDPQGLRQIKFLF